MGYYQQLAWNFTVVVQWTSWAFLFVPTCFALRSQKIANMWKIYSDTDAVILWTISFIPIANAVSVVWFVTQWMYTWLEKLHIRIFDNAPWNRS